MKFYKDQFNQLIEKIDKGILKALCLYGPNLGMITKICNSIVKKFDWGKTVLYYNSASHVDLESYLNTKNFFSKKELVRISCGNYYNKDFLENLLCEDLIHFPVFIFDDLKPKVPVRLYFEIKDFLGILACYHEDEKSVIKILLNQCSKFNKVIEEDAMNYLKLQLVGDYQNLINEINKLFIYCYRIQTITLSDVLAIISTNTTANLDILCIYLAKKQLSKFIGELEKLIKNDVNEIFIIRSLLKFLFNLYIIKEEVLYGADLSATVRKVIPSIFYKFLKDFEEAFFLINIDNIIKAIEILQQTEILLKKHSKISFSLFIQLWFQNYEEVF